MIVGIYQGRCVGASDCHSNKLPRSDAKLFILCDGRIGVTAINSCHASDCYAFYDLIRKEAIARIHIELKESRADFAPFGHRIKAE